MIHPIIRRTLFFARLFLLPHVKLFVVAVITGLIVAGSSGLGIPMMVKYVFPVVFYTEGSGAPLPKIFY